MNLLSIFLQATTEQNPMSFWIMMILIFVVMWLFMIRPQQKKQKEIEKQRSQIKAGDKVVTAGGIHGKVEKVQDSTFQIEIAKGVSIKIDKASVFAATDEAPKKEESKKDEAPKKEESKKDEAKKD